ncbi:hypothetical protein J4219_02010 [Candidatus Woesearchaeota archaeon]|nr:hypothetical protein [Candidatus Woesearchaeota archaeon]
MTTLYPARGAMISLMYDLNQVLKLRTKTEWGTGTKEQSDAWALLFEDIQKLLNVLVKNKSGPLHKQEPKEMSARDLQIVKRRVLVFLKRATDLATRTKTYTASQQNAAVAALLQASNDVDSAIAYLINVENE